MYGVQHFHQYLWRLWCLGCSISTVSVEALALVFGLQHFHSICGGFGFGVWGAAFPLVSVEALALVFGVQHFHQNLWRLCLWCLGCSISTSICGGFGVWGAVFPPVSVEALALVFGVQHFHQDLHGRMFMTILGSKKGIPSLAATRLQCWVILRSG